jgi:hypothetical protein
MVSSVVLCAYELVGTLDRVSVVVARLISWVPAPAPAFPSVVVVLVVLEARIASARAFRLRKVFLNLLLDVFFETLLGVLRLLLQLPVQVARRAERFR